MARELIFRLLPVLGPLAGCLGAILLIWTMGPYLGPPFNSNWTLSLASFGVLLLYGLYQAVRWIVDRRKSDRLASAIMESGGASSPEEVRRKFAAVIEAAGRQKHEGKPLRFQKMPWYLVIGPPGSGKTSALRASGLRFPARDLVGAEAVRGVGGTRNCSWWISTEAVLVDTAGRYTTQTSADGADRLEWEAFLDVLKSNRAQQPVNGLFVFVAAESLCTAGDRDFDREAAAIADRIREAGERFGIALPVYVFLSKMDRLPGFVECFEEAPESERRRALGVGLGTRELESDPGKVLLDKLQDWLEAVERRAMAQLPHERHRGRKESLLSFSGNVNSMAKRMEKLITRIANAGDGQHQADVRGVYFCSALQTGEMLDRVVAAFGSGFSRSEDEAEDEWASAAGRPYFIEGALREVAFGEASLAGSDIGAVARSNRRYWIAVGAMASVALLLVGAFAISFLRNSSLLADSLQATEARPSQGAFANQVGIPALDALDGVRQVATDIATRRPLSYGLGLAQAPGVLGVATDAYRSLSNAGLLPYLARNFEEIIQDPNRDAELRFELLKVYLMLVGHPDARLDARQVQEFAEVLIQGGGHAQDASLGGYHAARAASLGGQTLAVDRAIAAARQSLLQNPAQLLADVAIWRIGIEFEREQAAQPPFSLEAALGPLGHQVFQFDPGVRVPPIYSAEGAGAFEARLDAALADLLEHDWVLGLDRPRSEQSILAARELAIRSYTEKYVAAWRALLEAPRLRATGDMLALQAALEALAGPNSPLLALITSAYPHLALRGSAAGPHTSAPATGTAPSNPALARLTQQMGSSTQAAQDAATSMASAGERIRRSFEELIGMVEGSRQPSLQELRMLLGLVSSSVAASQEPAFLSGMGAGQGAQIEGALAALRSARAQAAGYPPPVQGWLSQLSAGAGETLAQQARTTMARETSQRIKADCADALLGLYPFNANAREELPPAEFARLFGPAGYFASTFAAELSRSVSRAPGRWVFRPGVQPPPGVSERDLEAFRLADQIANDFRIAQGGGELALRASVTRLSGARSVAVEIGEASIDYAYGPIRPRDLRWSPGALGGVVVRFVSDTNQEHTVQELGDWSLLRAIDRWGTVRDGAIDLDIAEGGSSVRINLQSPALNRLFTDRSWRSIICPGR